MKAVRLSSLTPAQRDVVLALIRTDEAKKMVEKSTREQGLPAKLEDPVVIRQVTTILRSGLRSQRRAGERLGRP